MKHKETHKLRTPRSSNKWSTSPFSFSTSPTTEKPVKSTPIKTKYTGPHIQINYNYNSYPITPQNQLLALPAPPLQDPEPSTETIYTVSIQTAPHPTPTNFN